MGYPYPTRCEQNTRRPGALQIWCAPRPERRHGARARGGQSPLPMSAAPYGPGPRQRIGPMAHLLRAARRRGQHFLTGSYPWRNRAGVVTVAQYWKPASGFLSPLQGPEAGTPERNTRGPGRHRAPLPHLQRVKLRGRVRRAPRVAGVRRPPRRGGGGGPRSWGLHARAARRQGLRARATEALTARTPGIGRRGRPDPAGPARKGA
jgi:hypothetical protein